MTDTAIQVGDVGTEFLLEIVEGDGSGDAVDVSAATTLQIKLLPPGTGAVVVVKTASLKNDGLDGKIRALSGAGDLSVPGSWQVQGYVVTPSGSWHTSIGFFAVKANVG